MRLCLMAFHVYHPGLVLQQEQGLPSMMKGFQCQHVLSSAVVKPEIIRYQAPSLMPNPWKESYKSHDEWFRSNQIDSVILSIQRLMFSDVQACTRNDEVLQFLMSGTAEGETIGIHISLLSGSMGLQVFRIDMPQLCLSPSLIYPQSKLDIQKPELGFVRDSAFISKVMVHSDGLVTFTGTEAEMKDLLSVVAERYLSKSSQKWQKQSVLVPSSSRLDVSEAEAKSHSSMLKNQSTLTAPLKSPQKVKIKPSPKKNKKVGRERNLYKKNYLRACESLLSLMVDKKQRRKTAMLSLKKSSPELPELLTQISAGIAGTGLAVLLSVVCNVACGRVLFCASKLFNTGFGFGLVWLSWSINKLRQTVISISKNAGKFGLKDEMILKLDKSITDIYFRAAAVLAVAVSRFA